MSRPERSGIVTNRTTKKTTSAVASTRTPHGFFGSEIPSQRSKSRSPSRSGSGSRSDPFTLFAAPIAPTIKRKRSSTSVGAITTPATPDETDRGQRIKTKPSVASSSGQNRVLAVASGSSSSHRPRKERERSRVASEYVQRLQLPNPVPFPIDGGEVLARRGVDKGKSKQLGELGAQFPPTPSYSGPLAAAEYERMRKELETLKKDNKDAKKQLKKQNKTIEELRAQVAAETFAREEQEKTIAAVSLKSRKNEELLQTIEVSLQCQICIELLSKPYALAPCGHILCLECLQQWFRAAPSNDSDDEMLDREAQEDYILHREKSCPCCRATVLRRPVPVFVVKSVVTALRAAVPTTTAVAQGEEEADPWKGLFLPDYESTSDDDDGEGYESSEGEGVEFFNYSEDDLDGAEVELAMGLGAFPQELARFYESASGSEDGSASVSDDDEEEEEEVPDVDSDDSDSDVVYSLARWEPPAHTVEFDHVHNTLWKMQRRGCTPRLIALFNIRYAHDEGLVAHVSSLDGAGADVSVGRNRLFLGWNIDIDISDGLVDGDSEKSFIARQLCDLRRHPERWLVSERHGYPGRGIVDARRLAPVEEEGIYDTSDSEAYGNV
ncbi:hypothetical protein DFH09DRAFT_1155044 [Mycena vulgaris]|nr:hypothetical protein DFH09DRAFT_1155044 [Mycena vulgaris]